MPPVTALLLAESRLNNSTRPMNTATMPVMSSDRLRVSQPGFPGFVAGGGADDRVLSVLAEPVVLVTERGLFGCALLFLEAGFPFAGVDFELDFLAGAAVFPVGGLLPVCLFDFEVEEDFSAMLVSRIIARIG
jgi:hypothetical protein